MIENNEFPWEYIYEHRESEVIRMVRLNAWLHRCIEDYPRPNEQTFTSCDEWFYKWFSQFMNEEFYSQFGDKGQK